MRYLFLGFLLLLSSFSLFCQEVPGYSTYSYAEFFQMIEDEEDTVFELSNALIIPNPETDQEFSFQFDQDGFRPFSKTKREINKRLNLSNIYFKMFLNKDFSAGISNVTFNKKVRIYSCKNLFINASTFNDSFEFYNFSDFDQVYDDLHRIDNSRVLYLLNNKFNGQFTINSYSNGREISYGLTENSFQIDPGNFNRMLFNGRSTVEIDNNKFIGDGLWIELFNATEANILKNTFDVDVLRLELNTSLTPNLNFRKNEISGITLLGTKVLSPAEASIDWNQFNDNIYELSTWDLWLEHVSSSEEHSLKNKRFGFFPDSISQEYFKEEIKSVSDVYKQEISSLGKYYQFYKDQHDSEFSNQVYIKLKDLETQRLAYIYNENPSFKTFFKWRINQFLKEFSAYGTEPERALIFSVYVIITFAIIYLFFPNYWDSHGKNRIVDRYSFFLKYMKRDAGMQEVYLEEKKSEILAYQDYKELIESSGKEVPKFFQATALPMYKWAISGTRLTASLLSKIDVMKGTWSELPQSKRVWKSVLLISAFLIALLYDIFIKMLNALMLSINTFTTLGFGEIPIKGLPRYLAIIQGFIGWFMLTIFSVSLISQLLN